MTKITPGSLSSAVFCLCALSSFADVKAPGLCAGCVTKSGKLEAEIHSSAAERAIDPAAFGFAASASPAVNSAALQKAIDRGTGLVRIGTPGRYLMGKPVMMPSDFTLECAKGVILEKGIRSPYILINDGAWYGHSNSNIVLRGLELRANTLNRETALDEPWHGMRGLVTFYRTQHVAVEDFRCFDCTDAGYVFAYCLQFVDFKDIRVENFEIRAKKDGIHLNGGCDFVIRNGVTTTLDDAIALNAGEWPVRGQPYMASIENGLVENIVDEPWKDGIPKVRANFARVITGCWREWHRGMKLQRGDIFTVGKNVYSVEFPQRYRGEKVSTIPPTHTNGLWTSSEGIPYFWVQGDGNQRADIRNVVFRNIRLSFERGISCHWEVNTGAGKARLIHPDIRPVDYPVTQIVLENVRADQERAMVTGYGGCDVTMRNCAARRLFADVGQWPGYETRRKFTLEDCEISEGDGKACDFKVDGTSVEIIIKGRKPSRRVKTSGTAAVTENWQ